MKRPLFRGSEAGAQAGPEYGYGLHMGAKKVLLMASGEEKAEAIYRSVCGPITPRRPGSILQLHSNVVLVADEAALSKVTAAGAVL